MNLNLNSEFVIALFTALTFLAVIVGAMWRFSKSVDRNTYVSEQTMNQLKAQWTKIDNIANAVDNHNERIIKLETLEHIRKCSKHTGSEA